MQKRSTPAFFPIAFLFIILSGFFVSGRSLLEKWEIDQNVLIIGNIILFAATSFSFWLGAHGLKTNNPQAIVRSVYGSFIVKFFILVIAAFVYIMITKKNVNKPALFICMALYVVYTFLEVRILLKLAKKKENA
jgi:hypothetical protein